MEEKEMQNRKLYYKNGMMGGTEKDRDDFYNFLQEVKNQSINNSHRYDGDYSIFTYNLNDGSKAIYTINDNYGIPHSIEVL